jgi:hypothetical protein
MSIMTSEKRLATALTSLFLILLLTGCGSKTDTPEKTFNSFVSALRDGDVEQARKLCHPAFLESEGKDFSEHLASAQKELINEIDWVNIMDVTIRGNDATVTIKVVENDGSVETDVWRMKKIEDRWLIFDL